MDGDESLSPSLDHSDFKDQMIVAAEPYDLSKKRKLRAEESDLLLPFPKHFCLEQQASLPDSSCPSSDIDTVECAYAMEDTKTGDETSTSASFTESSLYMFKDSVIPTGSSSSSSGYVTSSIDQCCSKVDQKTQEDVEDLYHMEFICPGSDSVVEDLQEVLNPVGPSSYILSSARWSVRNQDSEDITTTKPTIDQEFEQFFSTLMM